MTALAMILSYVESLIPVFFGVPGMKLGLTNLLVVFALYRWGGREALIVNFMRILLTGFLFGNPYSIAYSLSGGFLSLAGMAFLKRTGLFSVIGVSMAGGILHNAGQIGVAIGVTDNYRLIHYFPVLLLTGCLTGFLIGILSDELLRRIGRVREG